MSRASNTGFDNPIVKERVAANQGDYETALQIADERGDHQNATRYKRKLLASGGARYGRTPTTHNLPGEELDADTSVCQNCGHAVSSELKRTEGDNNGIVWHCFECTTASAMKNGAGAMPDYERRCLNTGALGGGL